MALGTVRVVDAGLLTTIQDAMSRTGLGRYGIPPGGAMDAAAANLANRLVGNAGTEPVLEVTLLGPTLEWTTGAHVGVAGGDLGASSAGRHLPPGNTYRLRRGALLRFEGARIGARAYVAVGGGFDIAPVLGSTSTDRRSGFGGFDGRELRAGDVLRFGERQSSPLRSAVGHAPDSDEPLWLIPTPARLGWFAPSAVTTFCTTVWTVAPDSDRNGIRLTGARLATRISGIPSLGVPVGSVQVPPSGEPIITMVDGPVTGGYPVVGVIQAFDRGRLAQAAPGTVLRFRRASVREARERARTHDDLDRVELDLGDFEASWAR